jgi:enhancing lycopene biosynthesis protein 2
MATTKRVAVILSGCGVFDGSEIHEATLSLLALDQRGAVAIIAAPDVPQAKVHDHSTATDVHGETRNVLVESGRIARGNIRLLSTLSPDDVDAVILPGGFGAALNLSTLATAGADLAVEPTTLAFLKAVYTAGKPLCALCIAPPILAKVLAELGIKGVRMTIGNDPATAAVITALGQTHVTCPATSFVADPARKIVTSPAYMLAGGIAELWMGINAAVGELLELA